jgi:hypothetical protein
MTGFPENQKLISQENFGACVAGENDRNPQAYTDLIDDFSQPTHKIRLYRKSKMPCARRNWPGSRRKKRVGIAHPFFYAPFQLYRRD